MQQTRNADIMELRSTSKKATCAGGCNLDLKTSTSAHSVERGKILHISFHSFPKEYRLSRKILFYSMAAAWLAFLTRPYKLRAVFGATAYSFIEYAFTFINDGTAYTSFAQFFGNLLYVPILLDGYGFLFYENFIVYVLFFPVNIWLLEIVLNHLFRLIYGRNIAWCYHSYEDSKLNGVIRVGHGKFWLLLGIACHVIYPTLKYLTEK